MRNEFKILNYKDIREDDREIRVLCNTEGQIVLWNPNVIVWEGDESQQQAAILEQADKELTEDIISPSGTGWTVDEALADYIRKINKKTLCFRSVYDDSFYLVTFDFDDPSKYTDDEDELF